MHIEPEKTTGHYIHNITYNHRERVVGLFVFSAFILFSALIIISGKSQHLFEKRVTFYLNVNSSEGLSEGSIVKTLGTEVGKVVALNHTQHYKIRITIEIYEGRHELIKTDARAIVNRLAGISDVLIEIESDSMDAAALGEGSTIPVEETPSLNDLILSIASLIQSADNNNLFAKFETILPKLETTVDNVQKIIAQIATGHGTLGAAVFDQKVEKNLKTVVKSGAEILSEAEGIISVAKQRLIQLEPVLLDAKYVTQDLREVSKRLPEMVSQLNDIILQANNAMALINGELIQIPGTAIDVKRALSKTDQLLDSAQNIWPLSSNIEEPVSKQLISPHAIHE